MDFYFYCDFVLYVGGFFVFGFGVCGEWVVDDGGIGEGFLGGCIDFFYY